jgi:nucleoside-diphosphate-sugar epimerase
VFVRVELLLGQYRRFVGVNMAVQDSKRLGWRARTSLEDGIRSAYRAFLNESKQATE